MPRKLPGARRRRRVGLVLPAQAVAAGFGKRTLRVGMSGSDVQALQRYLTRSGTTPPPTAQFGPGTSAA